VALALRSSTPILALALLRLTFSFRFSFQLQPVGIKEEKGEKKLAMIENGSTNGIVWEFVDVT